MGTRLIHGCARVLRVRVCSASAPTPGQERYPEDFAARDEDKLNYRYRGGEVGFALKHAAG